MIQLNLLPDIKQQFMRAQRLKRLVILGAFVLCSGAIVLTASLFTYVNLGQKRHITNLTSDINAKKQELATLPNIDRILTVQNQLSQLPSLHDGKPVVSRLFLFLSKVTPTNIGISSFHISTENHKVDIEGTAPSFEATNVFIDTLKFAQYQQSDTTSQPRAFSKVILVSTAKIDKGGNTFAITMEYDPALTDFKTYSPVSDGVVPIVNSTITTRELSESVFQTTGGK